MSGMSTSSLASALHIASCRIVSNASGRKKSIADNKQKSVHSWPRHQSPPEVQAFLSNVFAVAPKKQMAVLCVSVRPSRVGRCVALGFAGWDWSDQGRVYVPLLAVCKCPPLAGSNRSQGYEDERDKFRYLEREALEKGDKRSRSSRKKSPSTVDVQGRLSTWCSSLPRVCCCSSL